MEKRVLSFEEISILKTNKYVKYVSKSTVTYTDEFLSLYDENCNSMTVIEFFEKYFDNYELLGRERIKNCYYRWTKNIRERGTCRSRKKLFSGTTIENTKNKDRIIERQKLIIETLKQEADFLRQIQRLERRYQPQKSPSKKNTK